MVLHALVLKLLLKIVLLLVLSVEKSLNRWCDTTGNAILNPPVFFSLNPPNCYHCGISRPVALQGQHSSYLIPPGPKREDVHRGEGLLWLKFHDFVER